MDTRNKDNTGFGIGHMITRILVSAVVLAVVALLTPGFTINGIWPLLLAAVFIGGIDYLIERFTGFDASPFGRGLTGFLVSAVIIYAAGYFINGVRVGIISSLIAAAVIGIINAVIPGRTVL